MVRHQLPLPGAGAACRTEFRLRGEKPVAEFLEAKALGYDARPVLLGPVSFLFLSKAVDGSDRLALLDRLLPVYVELLGKLEGGGRRVGADR